MIASPSLRASLPRIFPRKFPALFGEGEHALIHAGAHMRDVIRNQAIDFKETHISPQREFATPASAGMRSRLQLDRSFLRSTIGLHVARPMVPPSARALSA